MAAQTYEISPRVLKKYFMIERSERVKNYLFVYFHFYRTHKIYI